MKIQISQDSGQDLANFESWQWIKSLLSHTHFPLYRRRVSHGPATQQKMAASILPASLPARIRYLVLVATLLNTPGLLPAQANIPALASEKDSVAKVIRRPVSPDFTKILAEPGKSLLPPKKSYIEQYIPGSGPDNPIQPSVTGLKSPVRSPATSGAQTMPHLSHEPEASESTAAEGEPAEPTLPTGLQEKIETQFAQDVTVISAYKDLLLAQTKAQQSLLAEEQAHRELMADREKQFVALQVQAFRNNARATTLILVISHFVLACGLLAAGWEFWQASRTRKRASTAAQSEITIGLEGVAFKSALNGLLLLVLSMSFYFLYLKFVYPVTTVGS